MADTIRAQHQSIDHALLELDALLESAERSGRLSTSVGGLAMLLQAHFEHEERSYLFVGLVEDYPRFAHQIEALAEEHVEMLAEIRSIADSLGELHFDIISLRLRALMTRLGLHEEKEIDLLQHAHTDDIAPAD
jgi:hypothetical protein